MHIGMIVRRLLVMIITLLAVSILIFTIMHVVPGDPVVLALAGSQVEPETIEAVRHEFGLDRPLHVQYIDWITGIFTGDFGYSLMRKAEIVELVEKTYGTTLLLMAGGFVVAFLLSLPLAIIAALREGKAIDQIIISGTLLFLSIPVFIMGILGILFFSFHLQWLPSFGRGDGTVVGTFKHMLLPWLVLGLSLAALQTGTLRAALLDVLKQDYIFAAEARGFRKWRVIGRHAMRSALVPFLNVVGLQFGYMIVGSVLIDYVFGLGGLGVLLLTAVNGRDYPLAQTLIMLIAFAFSIIVLAVDVLCSWLDPRYAGGQEG